nr:MAG TPA: hypothetical protein [Caudoviricetes sp.]DAT43951.1 MAG TPA: hypothetical protein [Caudoviricetes sp.]
MLSKRCTDFFNGLCTLRSTHCWFDRFSCIRK